MTLLPHNWQQVSSHPDHDTFTCRRCNETTTVFPDANPPFASCPKKADWLEKTHTILSILLPRKKK